MRQIDIILLVTVTFLTFFGLLVIYDASSYIAFRDFTDKYHYIKEQSKWIVIGYTALIFFSFFDYHKLHTMAVPILLGAIVLLIAVLIPGVGLHLLGASRWINLGFVVIQPAEFVKLALAIYLSAWFAQKEKGRLGAFLLLIGFVLLLVMAQPDMGTAIIILSEALVVYFLSGGAVIHFLALAPALAILGFVLIKIAPYRAARLTAFLSVDTSLEKTSYHVKQILIALGMGGMTGVGLGNSLQKYAYLPENTTDSIFAIIAEELGFIGGVLLMLLFIVVLWRGFTIAIHAKDNFGKLLAGGVTAFLVSQAVLNLSAQVALLPLTGVPLPFISYGGSALVVDLCAVGILLNISRQGAIHT